MKIKSAAFVLFLLGTFSCHKSESIFNNGGNGNLNNRSVGASANELLSANTYKSVKIEIQYMTGFAPDANAISHLQSMLNTYINKPSGITITTKEIAASATTTLSIDQVRTIEEQNRTVFTNGNQLGVYILYTNGDFTDNHVIGAAFRNTSIVLFGKTIHDNSGGFGQASRTKLEATVIEHEFGHLFGLVDIGSPMQTNHKDTAHGDHCTNSNCLMYYATDTGDMFGFLVTGNIPTFDVNCAADLHANGGK